MLSRKFYSSLLKSSLLLQTHQTTSPNSSLINSLDFFNDLKSIFPNHARTLTDFVTSKLSSAFSYVLSHHIHRDLPRLPHITAGSSSNHMDMIIFNDFWKTSEEWRTVPGSLKFDLWVTLSSQKELGRDLISRLDYSLAKLEGESNGQYAEWRSALEELKFRTKYLYTIMLTIIYSFFIGDFLFQKPSGPFSTTSPA